MLSIFWKMSNWPGHSEWSRLPYSVYYPSCFIITLYSPLLWLWFGISSIVKVCYSSPPLDFIVYFPLLPIINLPYASKYSPHPSGHEPSKLKNDLASKITESVNEKELAELIRSYEEPYDHDFALADAIEEFFAGGSLKEIFEKLENNKKIETQDFCKKTLEILREQCPFSLRIIFDELKRGKEMEVEDCFKMEFRLTQR